MPDVLQLPRQARGISLRAESFDAAANTIDVVFTTGAAVLRFSWSDGPYVETLDVTPKAVRLGRLNAGAPFLKTHASFDLSDIIGAVVPGTARLAAGEGLAQIKLSAAEADADVVGKIRDGVIRNISVGYIIHEAVWTEAKDGGQASCRVTDWEPIEISAVPIPADPAAQIRSGGGTELFPCTVVRAAPTASPATVVPNLAAAAARARLRMRARLSGLR